MLELNLHPFPVLGTERLILREIVPEDAEIMYAIRMDDRYYQFIDNPQKPTREEVKEKVQRAIDLSKNNEGISWGIELKNNSKLIGSVDYWRMIKAHHRCEIGYMLHPDYYQQGLMYEALMATIAYAFKHIKLHTIEANISPENIASIKLVEKCGFEREGLLKESYLYNGNFLDTAIYCLLNTNN
jgi:ribosomal-protein-alanine N-acetyltransferase